MNNGPRILDDAPDHVCEIDCKLVIENGTRKHIMYQADPTTAAGRYQYDRNREIYTMGKGARAAMRATGQSDTRTNREWNYGRKLWYVAKGTIAIIPGSAARIDVLYARDANEAFGPDRRPFKARNIRKNARENREKTNILKSIDWEIYKHSRPAYLPQSEHDPNL